jgi:hypothetical protein
MTDFSSSKLDHFDGNFSGRSQGLHQTCQAVLDASFGCQQMFTDDGLRGAQQSWRAVCRHQKAAAPYTYIAIGNALHDALWLCKQHRLQLWVDCMHGIDHTLRCIPPSVGLHQMHTIVVPSLSISAQSTEGNCFPWEYNIHLNHDEYVRTC